VSVLLLSTGAIRLKVEKKEETVRHKDRVAFSILASYGRVRIKDKKVKVEPPLVGKGSSEKTGLVLHSVGGPRLDQNKRGYRRS